MMKFRVQPVQTGANWMEADPCLEGVAVGSKTAAIKACRDAGYRVLSAGGLVELGNMSMRNSRGDLTEQVWSVTVWPTRQS
jgi:hypothetical protein